MSLHRLAGLDWAISGKLLSSVFYLVGGASAVFLLPPGQLGTYLMAMNLLALFQISDFGSTGFLTVRSGHGAELSAEARTVVMLTNVVSAGVFGFSVGVAGALLFSRGEAATQVFPIWGWVLTIVGQVGWQCVLPLVSFMDGRGQHRPAWRLMFFLETLSGLGLVLPLLFRNPFGSLLFWSMGRLVMAPVVLTLVWRSPLRQAFKRPGQGFGDWRRLALPFQAAFFWVNITGFVATRTILPLAYYFQGARQSGQLGVAFAAATVAFNLCTAWPYGSMGRLSVAFAGKQMGSFHSILRLIQIQSTLACGLLLTCAAMSFEALRRSGIAQLEMKIPPVGIYAPISLAHFLMILGASLAVAIRSTGRDTSALAGGWLGIGSIGVYAWTAGHLPTPWLPWSFCLVNLIAVAVFAFYWRQRRAALPDLSGAPGLQTPAQD